MSILRDDLIISFGMVQPEVFLREFCDVSMNHFDGCIPPENVFLRYAGEYFHGHIYEENINWYKNMCSAIKSRGQYCGGTSIFALIPEYTLHALSTAHGEPLCRQDQKLNWRICYLHLGQDLLVCAHKAYLSVTQSRKITQFDWPSVIGTDDRRLFGILEKGLAENHFHLGGSTRGFDISWICLMNCPRRISEFLKENKSDINKGFKKNLNSGISFGTLDNRLSWKSRLIIACWLRVQLFGYICTHKFNNSVKHLSDILKYAGIMTSGEISNMVSEAKYVYGRQGRIKQPDGRYKCLDYAITDTHAHRSCNRILTGERRILFQSFYLIYSGGIDDKKELQRFEEMFYLYLLIKTQFRREIIQTNNRYGFKNFADYQDRKDIIFDSLPMYAREAYNLSVLDAVRNGKVKSLEMRTIPKKNFSDTVKKIDNIDNAILSLSKGTNHSSYEEFKRYFYDNCFYVFHFPKRPEKNPLPKHRESSLSWLNSPQNKTVRRDTKFEAYAIALSFKECRNMVMRIRGIDSCTFEIPCRPEVFATEFRFLRDYICTYIPGRILSKQGIVQPKISATYHAGEDFMDIIDGLRAIDEALRFLEMQPGERLGHAIALGTDAHIYYELKHYMQILTKQNYLDNIVWALNKARSFDIDLGSAFKQRMTDKASELIYEIFGKNYDIRDYFNSWKLRGDAPGLYRFGHFNEAAYTDKYYNSIRAQYNRHMIADYHHRKILDPIRKNEAAAYLYFLYHFDYSVREKGAECTDVPVTEEYIALTKALQAGMRREIADKRIAIECNPSSNVLIGPFDRYDKHPIFTFCPVVPQKGEICQFVSVNTDDQGVFDTSLEEEYALLECALRKQGAYSDMEIYDYLERLRQNGFAQVFPKA